MDVPKSHIFSCIAYCYDRAVLLTARRWERLVCRVSACYKQLAFLHTCLREDLPPKSLRKRPILNTLECRQALRQYQRRMVRGLINDQHRRIETLGLWIQRHREQCGLDLTEQHFQLLYRHVQLRAESVGQQVAARLRNKTDILREVSNNKFTDRLVHNFSSVRLTRSQLSLLQRDVGHNLTDAHLLDFIAALEPAIHHGGIGEDSKCYIKQQVTGLLMRHRWHQALSREEALALKQLKNNSAIIILPADKGRATVVLDKTAYVTKALELLNDRMAYRVVERDPTTTVRNKINKLLDSLKRAKRIDDGTLRKIRPNDSALPRFYGLPKVHKEGVPLRPIVSFRGTPVFGLAKWLSGRISYLVDDSTTTVKSSEEFLERIKALRVEEDEVMASFDVTSLFTSIPRDLAITVLRDQLERQEGKQQRDSLRVEDLVKLIGVCLATYFTFQGTTYEQTKGTPMGSPISSVIAEAVLQQLEREAMSQYQPKFWARYVDDTFVVIKRCQLASFMGILNSVYPEIRFTVEEENRGSIAFLDVLVQRPLVGLVSTKVYRKPTHTDRILHYNSNHPISHKVSCIRTLFKRVYSHCSTVRARAEERRHLYRICRLNGYPSRFINRHSRKFGPRQYRQEEPSQERMTRISLPYINNVSEATARLLAPYNIRVAHKPDQTLRSKIMRPKDPLPTADRSAVVYRINCMDCQSNYVGETSKRLRTRLQEHKLAIKRGEQYSQIWSHMAESGHRFDFDHAQIVASDATKGGRLLKEAWFSGKNSVNRHIDMCPAQRTLRTWHTNHWRRSGRRPQDQEEDRNPLMSGANACVWLAKPSWRGEKEPVLSEPMCERSGTSVANLTTCGEDNPVSEEKGRSAWKNEWLRSGYSSRGEDPRERGGRSGVGSREMQPETAVARDVWEGNTQHDRTIELRSRKIKGGLDRNPAGTTKGVERERRGGVTRTLPSKQERNHEEGGETGIVTDEPVKGILISPRVNNKEVCDGTRRGRRQVLHPEVRRTHTHILGAQCAQLGPVTRSRSRAQKIGSCI